MPTLHNDITFAIAAKSCSARAVLRRVTIILLAACTPPALAQVPEATAGYAVDAAAADCEAAGQQAERDFSLPRGLLLAIGRVESGRRDLRTGRHVAWPWAINAQGQGMLLGSLEEAMTQLRSLQARGIRSIDVGCFQISLLHHPHAFGTMDQAFDARRNAQYAARFLTSLFARTSSWSDAVAAYHSSEPERGSAYRAQVFASWTGSDKAREPPSPARRGTDPVTILSTFIPPVRVWRPGDAGAAASLPRITGLSSAGRPPALR